MPEDKLIVALDVPSLDEAAGLVDLLSPIVKNFKIGSELFTACGPEVVGMVNGRGGRVFLDLKFHDIPNTVARAAVSAVRLGVWMFNMHAVGGLNMMKEAASAAQKEAAACKIDRPIMLAVTVLTSMDSEDLRESILKKDVQTQVLSLARLAKKAGLDGVVASAKELKPLRWAMGGEFKIVAPGIRPEWAAADDQKRVVTPKQAVKDGADYIVVGRPITKSEDPLAAAKKIIEEVQGQTQIM